MSKIENYLGIANHDIQTANNSQELKSYVASILCEIDELQQENQTNKTIIEKQVKRIYELEHTIEELKKWLEEHYDYSNCLRIKFVLNKIKELEEGVK